MTSAWFLRQEALQAIFHDEFWKSDHDFLIAFNSNFLCAMHGFWDHKAFWMDAEEEDKGKGAWIDSVKKDCEARWLTVVEAERAAQVDVLSAANVVLYAQNLLKSLVAGTQLEELTTLPQTP